LTYDLAIIGGGPTGASAAITAARAGARVLLLERGRFPRHKVCGEFVSAESLNLLRLLLGAGHAPLLNHAVRISQGRLLLDGRIITMTIEPPAASIARLELDAALWQSCRESGIDARLSTPVQSVTGQGPYRVATPEGDFEARAVINSSGRWSNLNPTSQINGNSEKWLGVKAHFAEDSPAPSVDLYFFRGGYCGVQPVSLQSDDSTHGRVNACAMVQAEYASSLPEVFALHPSLVERAKQWQPLSDPVSTSPLIFREPETVRDGVLLAGDAAGFVDPFVGDGISLALRSGTLAAQCLIPFFTGERTLEQARARYSEMYKSSLGPVFRTSSKLRQALLLPRLLRVPILALIQKMPAATQYLVRKTR
jgi:flavin-dependent dehydrogenase